MHAFSHVFGAIAFVSSVLLTAEPLPSAQVDAVVVKSLVERLESNRAAERAAAAKELAALGPGVLPHLPPPDRLEPPAAREAVILLRNTLERQLAVLSSQPTTVTLNRNTDRKTLLADVEQQTGNRLRIAPDIAAVPRAVTWDRRPYWQAIDDLFDPSTERLAWDRLSGCFQIEPRSQGPLPRVAQAGVFRVEATAGSLKSNDGDSNHILRVSTTWQAEPRLRPLFLRIKAADWHGSLGTQIIKPWNPDAEYELPFADSARQLTWPLDVLWPAVSEEKSWSLTGRATVHLAAVTETITFDSVALRPNVQRRRGGVAVRIRAAEFTPTEDRRWNARIRILVSYDAGGPAFESHRAWVFYQDASLLNRDGERIAFTDYETTQEVDGAVGVEYRFQNLPGHATDYRFAYAAPTLFLDVPLDIAIRDLPVPEQK